MTELTVTAIFQIKEGKMDEFMAFIRDPKEGIAKTRAFPGYKDIKFYQDQADKNKLILWQRWENEKAQAAYLKMRTDEGLFDTIGPLMAQPPQIIKQNAMDV